MPQGSTKNWGIHYGKMIDYSDFKTKPQDFAEYYGDAKEQLPHDTVAYHYVRNAVAASIITVAWINRNDNLADTFTKRLPEVTRNHLFLGNWMY